MIVTARRDVIEEQRTVLLPVVIVSIPLDIAMNLTDRSREIRMFNAQEQVIAAVRRALAPTPSTKDTPCDSR